MSQTAARPCPRNFVEHLRRLASERADDVALVVAKEQGRATADVVLSYAELDLQVRALAASLQARFDAGERALLLLENDERYAVAFLACLYAGLIAVPLFPPESSRPQHFALAIRQGQRRDVEVPPNLIPADCQAIKPEMLPLVRLTKEEIGSIEAMVPGGAINIQDIYPLAPLQEGILFHHLLQEQGDVYITSHGLSFDSRERLEGFIGSFNQVIARHDILRTAVLWEGLPEPVQVVYRKAELKVQWLEEVESGTGGSIAERLAAYTDSSRYRIDVRRAPLFHAIGAHDPERQRWLLQLLVHHLVDDNTTVKLIVEEIALIQSDRESELVEPVPFRRFVAQAQLGVSREEHEAYFKELLGDLEEPTTPFGLLDVRGDGTKVQEARLTLDAELARTIREQSRRHGVSAAALFHLAWALVLARTSGQDDVVFGTVLFGRMQGGEGADKALGMFINTLPARIRLGSRSIVQCLKQTHEMLAGLLHHEHATLTLAQRCSGLPPGAPLFSAMLNCRHTHAAKDSAGNDAAAWLGIESTGGKERTNYSFNLSVDDLGDGFDLVAQVDESVPAQWVCGFMELALEALLEAIGRHPENAIGELNPLSGSERAKLIHWGVNRERYSEVRPVHRLIEDRVREQPEAIALVFGGEELSYAELNARANRLANRLIALGIGPEVRVGVALERSTALIVSLLAVLKAGGGYVPLDPEYPVERLAYMVKDSGIGQLLTDSALSAKLPMEDAQILELDNLDLTDEPDEDPQVTLHGENLAYIIYTSGSTGIPKGAANRHCSLTNRLVWMQASYGLNANDAILQKTPCSFDVSVWEFFWPLMTGAQLVVAAPGDHRDPERLIAQIQAHAVSTVHFVPSMLQAFLVHEGIEACASLRRIICSGESLPPEVQAAVFARLPTVALYNLYGPTEAAIDVTHWKCKADGNTRIPIGQPIADTRTYVLDADLNLAPQGVTGELYLGGIGLARGYLNRSGLTAERFIADPFDGEGGRLYWTGDLVRWNRDGQLEYLGRIDHQVKIRGFRIELGEIEACLLGEAEIREAVVASDAGPGGARLVGYVSLHPGQEVEGGGLRERLGRMLPGHMVPSAIVVLESLPLNVNGKIDRRALPKPAFGDEGRYEAPLSEAEETLASIWAEVLGVSRVGRNDNFFHLGGHSIALIKTQMRVRDVFGVQVPLRTYFENPVLRDIGCHISAGRNNVGSVMGGTLDFEQLGMLLDELDILGLDGNTQSTDNPE
ncbi:MAG: amino acid adenylation domain-containing protein [Azoarcus sp.]|jgi:amino acid adenylation domain-containing protein|nr:amino acid adenylation domain-containing protein [Azoarcus sp.]